MTAISRATIDQIAAALVVLCPTNVLADVLEATVSCEADPRLTDGQVEFTELLFERLCQRAPEAMAAAQER